MVARQESQDEDEAGAQQLGLARLNHEPEDPEAIQEFQRSGRYSKLQNL